MKKIKVVDLKVGDKVYLDNKVQEVTKVGTPVAKGEGVDPIVEFFYETKDSSGNLHSHTYKFKKSHEDKRLIQLATFSKSEDIIEKLDKVIDALEGKVSFSVGHMYRRAKFLKEGDLIVQGDEKDPDYTEIRVTRITESPEGRLIIDGVTDGIPTKFDISKETTVHFRRLS